MLNWCTYLELFICKTYLGAFVLFVVGAPSMHFLTKHQVPEWKEYYASFRDLFLLLAKAEDNYMWPFILASFPVGFIVCELLYRINKWIGFHDNLDITEDQKLNEHFLTTIFIQRHEHVARVFRWESFQFNLFLCTEYALEIFLAFHIIANLVIGIFVTISKVNAQNPWSLTVLDPWSVITLALTMLFALLIYLTARSARKKKYASFKDVYKTIIKLRAQEKTKESTSFKAPIHEVLLTINKSAPHSSKPRTESKEKP